MFHESGGKRPEAGGKFQTIKLENFALFATFLTSLSIIYINLYNLWQKINVNLTQNERIGKFFVA